ncbi:hypothetical protein NDU88_000445 [Pleurodeles waltl]|uniref:Uncharacterized protein n=1 Tax=Pleurodeles waltl TaxID=8319 RepID=A0AAV7NAE4_PLEWA|nr:hypothetical protein NDU88_000445 [Pleurodeles waltl]
MAEKPGLGKTRQERVETRLRQRQVVTGRLAAVKRPPYRVFSPHAGRLIPQPGGGISQARWSSVAVITSLFRACALAPSPSFHLQARVRPWVVSPAAHEAPFPVITRKNAQEKRATGNHKNERNSEYKQWSKEYRLHQELQFNF